MKKNMTSWFIGGCVAVGIILGVIFCLIIGEKVALGIVNGAFLGLLTGTMGDTLLAVQNQ